MKIATVNINSEPSLQSVEVPAGARMQTVIQMGGTVQVYYSYDGPGTAKEVAQFRVVGNNEDYENSFAVLGMLVDVNKRVTHVVYKATNMPPVQINPL